MSHGKPSERNIVMDFDGTICAFRFPDTGPPEPDVREALERIRAAGYRVVIHSCRTRAAGHAKIIMDYMAKHDLPYDEICVSDKPFAMAYIDDRGIRYEGNWAEIAERVERGDL